jgi:outer membrane cobalamin receptor
MKNKFIISTDLFYVGSRWAKSNMQLGGDSEGAFNASDSTYEYKLKGFFDANFKVEYRYNKRLSAWVQVNNAFGLKYQRWGNYPVQQIVATLGATYAF